MPLIRKLVIRLHRSYSLSLNELLDIITMVEQRQKHRRFHFPHRHSVRAKLMAKKIIKLQKNEGTKEQAEQLLGRINRKIVQENKKTSNPEEGELLYNKLMRAHSQA